MDKKDIDAIIYYWMDILNEQSKHLYERCDNTYSFLPVKHLNTTKDNESLYALDGTPYIQEEAIKKFRHCHFIKKHNTQYALVNKPFVDGYCLNIDITAFHLWHNRDNNDKQGGEIHEV
ncbi:MAG: hypothetical protein J1F01_02445 [Oscillospiraceae bacterium]|nr:hypothetical protein [Oscillospiraceae bacterium]